MFWLGQTLKRAGHWTLPAESVEQASMLLGHVTVGIDLLVANYTLPGVPAFADALRRFHQDLKVIVVPEGQDEAARAPAGARTMPRRPGSVEEHSRAGWLDAVRRTLASGAP